MRKTLLLLFMLGISGCWDKVVHEYECPECEECEECEKTQNCGEDGGAETMGGDGQGIRPKGYEDFGSPCETNADCTGYERARCIPYSILGVVAVPNGYCTACCDEEGSECAAGIECIGYDDVYLICAAKCTSDDDCRADEGYECRRLIDVTALMPVTQTFCLPDEEHQTPTGDEPNHDIQCDWPWL